MRKPYTITKQRERWKEEEHEKFIEALKLYGRDWRQIEGMVEQKEDDGKNSYYIFSFLLKLILSNRACGHEDRSSDS